MNRIQEAIYAKEILINDRIGQGEITKGKVNKLHEDLDMDCSEHARFQELKSLACMEGALTLEESQLIYSLLGESPATFNRQELAVKAVLTLVFHELLKSTMTVS